MKQLILSIFIFTIIQNCVAEDFYKYQLSTGDRIKILVYGEPDLMLETTLDDDTIISYPFLGDIMVKGLSLGELENRIHNGLKDGYLRNPNVNISILKYRPFYINGEVKKPGSYSFQPGLTVQQAITIAGGFTERASANNIYVTHKNSNEKQKIKKNERISPGDTLTIDESFF